MTSELKPCPFCGGEADAETGIASSWVRCSRPGCDGEKLHDTIEAAIAAWNARAPDPRIESLSAEVERLREALHFYARENSWKSCGIYMSGRPNPSPAEIDRGNKARAALEVSSA